MRNVTILFGGIWCLLSLQSLANRPVPSNPPKAPISVVADDKGQRYLCMALLNIFEEENYGLNLIRDGAARGLNAVMITVRWDVVIKRPDAPEYWNQVDNQINLAKELGLKIFIRIHLHRHEIRMEGFWGDEAAPKDEQRGRTYFGMFSLSHQPTVDQSLGFVKQVTERYRNLQVEGRILCVAVTTTPTQEAGYHFINKDENGNEYFTGYDYSDATQAAYRQWVKDRYSNDIRKLNEAWRSDYSDFENIKPVSIYQQDKQEKKYTDWFVFRHTTLKNFLEKAARTIKSTDDSYKVVNDFGSVWDEISVSRGTFAFKSLTENVDGIKINDAYNYPHFMSADLLRSNVPADKWIMNEAFPESNKTHQSMIAELSQHFEGGCKLVNFVCTSREDGEFYGPVIEHMANSWLKRPMEPIVTKQSMVVKLSDMVGKRSRLMEEWNEKKNEGPVFIKFVEDLLGESDGQPNPNQPPVANKPFKNMTIVEGFPSSQAFGNDFFSDPDDKTPLAYEMSGLPAGISFDGQNIKGTPTSAGDFKVTIKAIDDLGAFAESQFVITVKSAQKIKIDLHETIKDKTHNFIINVKDKQVFEFRTLGFLANFFVVPEGDAKTVVIKMTGPIEQIQTETESPYNLFGDNNGQFLKVGKYTITAETYKSTEIKPEDALGRTVVEFTVEDKKNNQAPLIRNRIPDQKAILGAFIEYNIPGNIFQDEDGSIDNVAIAGLPKGVISRSDGLYFSGTPTEIGKYIIAVTATDNEGAKTSTAFVLNVTGASIAPIVVSAIADQAAVINQPFIYIIPQGTFTDADGYIVRYTVSGLPLGLSFLNGTITGRAQAFGVYLVRVRAIDNDGLWVETIFRLTTKLNNANLPPVASARLTNQQATVGRAFSYVLPSPLFRDPEGSKISLTAVQLPRGLILKDGAISGTPAVGGEFTVTIRGIDMSGEFTDLYFVMTVRLANGNLPPIVVKPIPDQEFIVGSIYNFSVPLDGFQDTDGLIVSLYVRGLPPGMSYQGGVISGNPTRLGTYTVTVGVFDDQGASVEDYFVIKVVEPPLPTLSFTLMRAGDDATRRMIQVIKNNDKIAMNGLPVFVNIFAESVTPADRIAFELEGTLNVKNTDGGTPFGLFDDYGGFNPSVGVYKLKATAFKDNKPVSEHTINFEFVRNARQGISEDIANTPELEQWVAFPNPFDETVTVNIPVEYEPLQTSFSILNLQGQRWNINWLVWNRQQVELNLAPFGLQQGIYLLQIQNAILPAKTIKIMKK